MEAIQTVGRTARSDAQVADHYGVRVHNPFADPQVILAALSVPGWLRASPSAISLCWPRLWPPDPGIARSPHRRLRVPSQQHG